MAGWPSLDPPLSMALSALFWTFEIPLSNHGGGGQFSSSQGLRHGVQHYDLPQDAEHTSHDKFLLQALPCTSFTSWMRRTAHAAMCSITLMHCICCRAGDPGASAPRLFWLHASFLQGVVCTVGVALCVLPSRRHLPLRWRSLHGEYTCNRLQHALPQPLGMQWQHLSGLCTHRPKLCGKWCDCPHHPRRRRRAGKTKGRSSKEVRQTSLVGLRVHLLEALLDHIVGSDPQELRLCGTTGRRAVRRSLIEVFVQEDDVHEAALHERWGIVWFLRYASRGLIEHVQRDVVAVATKLKYEPLSTATSSSSAAAAPPPGLPAPPGLATLDEVASRMELGSDTDEDILPEGSASDDVVPPPPAAAAVPSALSWWLEAVARSQAPRCVLPAELRFQPHGHFPWREASNQITAHIYRQSGAQVPRWLAGQSSAAMKQHIEAGSPFVNAMAAGSLARAAGMLHSWFQHRRGIADLLRGPMRLLGSGIVEQFSSTELLFGWGLAGATSCPAHFNQRGFHGTLLCTLQGCMQNGLATGWSFKSGGGLALKGIYHHLPQRVHLCSHYMIHTAVDNSGWYFAPMLEIRYPSPDPHGRPATVKGGRSKTNQNIAYPDSHAVVALVFHAVHSAHFLVTEKYHGHYIEGLFQQQWEIDPALSFEESVARSRPSTCTGRHLRCSWRARRIAECLATSRHQ